MSLYNCFFFDVSILANIRIKTEYHSVQLYDSIKRIRSSSRAPYSRDEKDWKKQVCIYWLDEGLILFYDK